MSENSGFGMKLVVVLLVGLVAAGAAIFLLFGGNAGPEEVGGGPDRGARGEKERQIQAKSDQLKKVLSTTRPENKMPPLPLQVPPSTKAGDGSGELTPREKAALKQAMDKVYDPVKLARALEDRTGTEYTREMSEAFSELEQASVLETGAGEVPITEPMKMILNRMNVLRAYSMNLLHTERPAGMEVVQWEQVQGVNQRFEERFATMMDEHPFLDLQMVEVPGP